MFARELAEADQSWKVTTLRKGWGATTVARLGELVDAAALPGFVAVDGAERIGLLTYAERAGDIEVVTIQALVAGRYLGAILLPSTSGRDLSHPREDLRPD